MENITGCLISIVLMIVISPFIAVFGGIIGWGTQEWESLKIAEGRNLIWLSIGVFLAFLIWQIYDLVKIFRHPLQKKRRNLFLVIAGGIATLIFIYIMVLYYLSHYGDTETKAWIASNVKGALEAGTDWYSVLVQILFSLFISLVMAGFLLGFLLLGRIAWGASLAVAVHNLANGGSFDLTVVIDALINTASEFHLNDIGALLVGIAWWAITGFLLKEPKSQIPS